MLARLFRDLSAAAILCLALAGHAKADLFTSPAVPVDVTAESAQAAQAQAFAQARAIGIRAVMMRLTAESDHGLLPEVSAEQLETMVTALQIADEKTAPDRYIARVSFQFNADSIRLLLRDNEIEFTEARALPVLVIPVLTEGGQASLWTDPSPWLDAWARQDGSQHLVPPIVPFGDVEDVVTLTPGQALAGDAGSILALARRYGAESALVFHAVLDIDPVNRNANVDVQMQSYGPDSYEPISIAFSGSAAEGTEPFLAAISELLISDISRQWKVATIQRFAVENELTALVPVTDLEDWLNVSRQINRVHLVKRQTLKALTVRDALITVTYGGEPELLQDALARTGLSMEQQPDGFWLLTRRDGAQ
jgi:hypothetical protein